MKSSLPPALGLTRSFIYICSGSGRSPVILCKSEFTTRCLSPDPAPPPRSLLLHGFHHLGGPLLPPPMVLGWGHLDGDEKEQRGDIPLTHIMRTRVCRRVEEQAVSTQWPKSLSPAVACLDLGNLTAAKPGSQQCGGGGSGGSHGPKATLGAFLALPRLLQPSSLPWPPFPLRSGIASQWREEGERVRK